MMVTEQQVKKALRAIQKERNLQENYPQKTVIELVDSINNCKPHRLKGRVSDIISCAIFEDEIADQKLKKSA